jgi:hypothetical protein
MIERAIRQDVTSIPVNDENAARRPSAYMSRSLAFTTEITWSTMNRRQSQYQSYVGEDNNKPVKVKSNWPLNVTQVWFFMRQRWQDATSGVPAFWIRTQPVWVSWHLTHP